MAGRTSQLQIRVSPEQKATLKRLAAAGGMNVSAYVLSRALPKAGEELTRALDLLRKGVDTGEALTSLARTLSGLAPEELEAAWDASDLGGMTLLARNRLAALAEWVAAAHGIEPPSWTADVPPLDRPHFRWPLESLRAYQTRASRTAYKRRNLFDPGLPALGEVAPPRAAPELDALLAHLRSLELVVEFYFMGGTVLWQAFPANPRSARPADVFGEAPDPVTPFLAARRLSKGWILDALQGSAAAPTPGWIDRAHLAAFRPPPAYPLAAKLACLRLEPSGAELDDLRFLLRSLNVTSPEEAWSVASRHLSVRRAPAHAEETLRRLFA